MPDVLSVLRQAPGGAAVLDALAGEPAVWIVGGAVRDALLGWPTHELDVVVEGRAGAAAVARRAAERLGGGAVTVHERFGTATVRAGAVVFDVVAARRESYAHPGALPDVVPGAPLAADLARRDFTVNTLAVRIADGALEAVDGAREDLRTGVLRVLHPGSFRDDPTRLVRMARYAARLGFAPDAGTAQLAREAVAEGALATVAAERLGRELRLLLREPQPDALAALARDGLGAAVLWPGWAPDAGAIAAALAAAPPDARADLVALAATVPGADGAAVAARLAALAFPAPDVRAVAAAAALPAALPAPGAALAAPLDRLPAEALAVLAARGDADAAGIAARAWRDDLRHRRLAIGGDDLLAAGLTGPAIGAALARARAALLDDRAPDRDAQLAAALDSPRA